MPICLNLGLASLGRNWLVELPVRHCLDYREEAPEKNFFTAVRSLSPRSSPFSTAWMNHSE